MEAPVRNATVSFKTTDVERAEIEAAAKLSGATMSEWVRDLALKAARGKRTEVRSDDLSWLREMFDRMVKLQLEGIRLLHEHTSHPDPNAEIRARSEAARKMEKTLRDLGMMNGDAS